MHNRYAFYKICLFFAGLCSQSLFALDYCRKIAANHEGYGPLIEKDNQSLRLTTVNGSKTCLTSPLCRDASNAEGYGLPFWENGKLYRKMTANLANSAESNLCLVHASWQEADLQLFEHRGQKLFLTGVNLGNIQFLPFKNAPYTHSESELKDLLRKAFADLKASGVNSFRFWLVCSKFRKFGH